MLNEKKIKCLLLDYIMKKYQTRIVGIEIPFLSGKRWADVLIITNNGEMIAFEIKSDLDSLKRMSRQLQDYTKTFDQVYVIFSTKFKKNNLIRALPKSIGYAFINNKKLDFDFIKQAYLKQRLSKENLLFFLWKKDLTKYQTKKTDTVALLRRRMKKSQNLAIIRKLAINALIRRYKDRFKIFLKEKSKRVQEDDLDYLTKTFWGTF